METKGWRAIPAPLLFGYALWLASMAMRAVFYMTADEPWKAHRFDLTMSGIAMASEILVVIGALDLARRLVGRARHGVNIAAAGFMISLAAQIIWGLASFKSNLYEHEWIFKAQQYVFWSATTLTVVGLVVAISDNVPFAVFVGLFCLGTWPPPFLQKVMFEWIPSGKTGMFIHYAIWVARFGVELAVFAAVARGPGESSRAMATSGLRTAANALWLRLAASVGIALLMLLAVGGGGRGALEMMKLALMAAGIINILALTQFGLGAVRSARAQLSELGIWPLVVAGACSLWAAGVTFAQLPSLYRMLYGKDDYGFGGSARETAQALSVAMPIVVIASVALVAIAIAGFAAARRNEILRAQAQGKGAAFVALMLVGVGVQWILPEAKSQGSAAMMLIVGAVASIVATVMMARLCQQAAVEMDSEATLPQATVVT